MQADLPQGSGRRLSVPKIFIQKYLTLRINVTPTGLGRTNQKSKPNITRKVLCPRPPR